MNAGKKVYGETCFAYMQIHLWANKQTVKTFYLLFVLPSRNGLHCCCFFCSLQQLKLKEDMYLNFAKDSW